MNYKQERVKELIDELIDKAQKVGWQDKTRDVEGWTETGALQNAFIAQMEAEEELEKAIAELKN